MERERKRGIKKKRERNSFGILYMGYLLSIVKFKRDGKIEGKKEREERERREREREREICKCNYKNYLVRWIFSLALAVPACQQYNQASL